MIVGSLTAEEINTVLDTLQEEQLLKIRIFGISLGKTWLKKIYPLLLPISIVKPTKK